MLNYLKAIYSLSNLYGCLLSLFCFDNTLLIYSYKFLKGQGVVLLMKKFKRVRNRLRNNNDLRLEMDNQKDFCDYSLKQLNAIAAASIVNDNWATDYFKQTIRLKVIQQTTPINLDSVQGLNLTWWEN